MGRKAITGQPVAVDQLGRLDARPLQLVDQAQPLQLTGGIGRQGDRRADLAQLRRLFVQRRLDPRARSASARVNPPIPAPMIAIFMDSLRNPYAAVAVWRYSAGASAKSAIASASRSGIE